MKGMAFGIVALTIMGCLLFGSAGTVLVPTFWGYLALWAVYLLIVGYGMAWIHPDLVTERLHPPSDRDPHHRKFAAIPLVGHYVLAGLDVRYGSWPVNTAVQLLGAVVLVVGMGFVAWTLLTNRFASSAIRIQTERSHRVVEHGPYALVRHPMYLGTVLVALGSGWTLASGWAAIALLPLVPMFVRRTLFEDRMLHRELPGYVAYARKTRSRLIPGLW